MFESLIARVKAADCDNALDVLIEIALFEPDEKYRAIRANNAGTKVIFTLADGSDETCWAQDWTMALNKDATIKALEKRGHTDAG